MLILMLTTQFNAFFVFSLMLLSGIQQLQKKKKKNRGPQADQRLLSSAKHWYILGEAELEVICGFPHTIMMTQRLIIWMSMPPLKNVTAECVLTI